MNINKNKIVFILIKVKPKYLIEFNIMMVACKKLCQRNNTQDGKLAKICDFFSIFGPFDFYLKISGDDKQIIQTTLLIREKFSIYINETCTLTSFEMSEFLSHESNILLTKLSTAKYKCPDEEPLIDTETLNKLKKFEHELDNNTNKSGKEQYDQRFVFIRVKPKFTEKFFLAINIFKNLCEHATSQEFAKINDIYYIVGLFDYLLEINRNNENKIGKTIFRIREILGDYIIDTVTIKKIYLPITNDEIKIIFKNIIGEEYIHNNNGEKIPKENNGSHLSFNLEDSFNLEEISEAEISSLRDLLKTPKFLLDCENSKNRMDEMENRIKELEKIINNK